LLFVWIPVVLLATSPSSIFSVEPLRGVLLFIGGTLSAGLLMVAGTVLHRDLTPAGTTAEGLNVGKKVIPYSRIESVDPLPGKLDFRLKLRGSKRVVYVSKVGIETEEAFFEELSRRILRG